MSSSMALAPSSPLRNRWLQLTLGIVAMIMIANLQYGWTLFVNPIKDKSPRATAAIQVSFTTFVVIETWLVPVEGYIIARFGPSRITMVGGVLVGISWVMFSMATSLPVFYLGAAIGGVGAGIVYGCTVGQALKWFPDRRGLAARLTAAGFGAGSAITIVPIAQMIKASGYQHPFLVFGIAQGIIVFIIGFLLRAPQPGEVPAV